MNLNKEAATTRPRSPRQVINPKGMRRKRKTQRKYKRNQDTKLQNASRAATKKGNKLFLLSALACQRQQQQQQRAIIMETVERK